MQADAFASFQTSGCSRFIMTAKAIRLRGMGSAVGAATLAGCPVLPRYSGASFTSAVMFMTDEGRLPALCRRSASSAESTP